jgi:hypothetical protein
LSPRDRAGLDEREITPLRAVGLALLMSGALLVRLF